MKKLLLSIITIATFSLAFIGCGSKESPKDVATEFTKKLNAFDFEGAKKLSTPETVKMLEMLSTFSAMMPDSLKEEAKNLKVEAKDETINGDEATVNIANGDKGVEKISLKKIKGKWLVHMTKDNMGGEGAGIPTEEGEMPTTDDSSATVPEQAPAPTESQDTTVHY